MWSRPGLILRLLSILTKILFQELPEGKKSKHFFLLCGKIPMQGFMLCSRVGMFDGSQLSK